MRTRRHAAALVVGLTLVLAACGGGSSDAGSSDGDKGGDGSEMTITPTSVADEGGSDSDAGSGDVDCTKLESAAQQLLSIQMLAQLNSPENVEAVKTGTIGSFDYNAFIGGMETLHELDGYDGPLGDPKPAIDAYIDAANGAKELFDADPPTQEQIDAYMESIGTTGEFIGHQTAIAGALDEAGC